MMFGEPVTRVTELIGEPRQIERITQGRGARRGRGHRRKIENGKRDHPNSLRYVASIAGYQRAAAADVNPSLWLLAAAYACGESRGRELLAGLSPLRRLSATVRPVQFV